MMKLFVENISFKPRTNYCLDFPPSHRGRSTKPNFERKAATAFWTLLKKNATLAWGGGRCRYIPRFVSPLSIFRKVQSENSLETFKILNSTQVRSKGCFKTGLILTKQFCMFFYLESWMAGDILKTGNVINHLTSLQVFRLWPPSELGQILIKQLQTQLLFQRHKSSQVNQSFFHLFVTNSQQRDFLISKHHVNRESDEHIILFDRRKRIRTFTSFYFFSHKV